MTNGVDFNTRNERIASDANKTNLNLSIDGDNGSRHMNDGMSHLTTGLSPCVELPRLQVAVDENIEDASANFSRGCPVLRKLQLDIVAVTRWGSDDVHKLVRLRPPVRIVHGRVLLDQERAVVTNPSARRGVEFCPVADDAVWQGTTAAV